MRIARAGLRGRAAHAAAAAAIAFAAWTPLGAAELVADDAQVQVVLESGERISGTLVKSDLEHIYLRLPDTSRGQSISAILTYDRARIRRIEEVSPQLPEYANRQADLPDTAHAHLELARWCVDAELVPQARAEALRSEHLRKDSDTETLLLRLGMTYAAGVWQDADADLARTGRVRYAGTIMTQEEAFRLQERASDNQAIIDTLNAISDDQVLLADAGKRREALEARARALHDQLAASGAAIAAAQAALRASGDLAVRVRDRDGNDGVPAVERAEIWRLARVAQDALPGLRKRSSELACAFALPARRAHGARRARAGDPRRARRGPGPPGRHARCHRRTQQTVGARQPLSTAEHRSHPLTR